MKKIVTLIIIVLSAATLFAQVPEKFSYQAVVRNASNQLVVNTPVGVLVSILQGGINGTLVYMETHTAVTNANGLLTLEIGSGSVQQGIFADIDWANGLYFLKTETDPNGGSDYSITSTQQLLSVPYTLYAKEVGNGFSGDYNDLTNLLQIPQNVSDLTNDAGYITMDSVPTNVSVFANDAGYITTENVPVQVNADWNVTEGVAQILNKPALFSGDYNDLTNKPDPCECLAAADVQALINSSLGAMQQQLDSLQNVVDALTGGSTTATLPTVTTSMVSNITETTATFGGNVTADGGAMVTARGVCWSISQNPTESNNHTTDGCGTGSFTCIITGLTQGTIYYVRAYSTNSKGTAYCETVTFTTID